MANDIKIPSFLNYTDCRKKLNVNEKNLSEIEKESIVNYAKTLSEAEISLFLSQLPTETLLAHLSFRMIETECKLENIRKKIIDTL